MSFRPPIWLFCDAPYAGGAERYLQWLLEGAGPEAIGLLVVDHPGLRPWIGQREAEGFRVERLAPAERLAQWGALVRCLRRLRPRVLHVNLPGPYEGMLATAPALARAAGVRRVLVTEHLPSVGRVGRRYAWKRMLLGAVDRAICVTREHRELMSGVLGYPRERVIAISNGVPDPNPSGAIAAVQPRRMPSDLAAQEQGGGVRLVQVGALDLRKGGDDLIEAAAILRSRGIAFQLWMVGEGPARGRWETRIREAGLGERVHLAGHRDDVHRIWRAAQVAVLSSEREGLPLSLLEASAHGLPMVATQVDGNPEIVVPGGTGLLVPPHDPRMLAWALGELVQREELRETWGWEARRRYERLFRLERMLQQTFALYGQGGGRGG